MVDVDVNPSIVDMSYVGAMPRDSVMTENYRGNLTYTLPVKYKIALGLLAVLSLSLFISVIV